MQRILRSSALSAVQQNISFQLASRTFSKVAIFGGSGQVGRLHESCFKEAGAEVLIIDKVAPQSSKSEFQDINTLNSQTLSNVRKAVVALPDSIMLEETRKLLKSSSIEEILLEKPGALSSHELTLLDKEAKEKEVNIFVNYQRNQDPRLKQLHSELSQLMKDGYTLDSLKVFACDKDAPPQHAHQVLNQLCHDIQVTLGILDTCRYEVSSLRAEGLDYEGYSDVKDTRLVHLQGTALSERGSKALVEIGASRVHEQGTYMEIQIRLSHFKEQDKNTKGAKTSLYTPKYFSLRFPEEADPNAHWSTVWLDAFRAGDKQFYTQGTGIVDLIGASKVLRICEVALHSLANQSKTVKPVFLSEKAGTPRIATLAASSGINSSGLVLPCDYNGLPITASLIARDSEDVNVFKNRYPHHPVIPFRSSKDLINYFYRDQHSQFIFYNPSVPTPTKHNSTLEVLKAFPHSIVLMEKPSHNTAAEAEQFLEQLKKEKFENRVLVGFHNSVHPARKVLREYIKQQVGANNQITQMKLVHNYPKDPNNPANSRIFEQPIGGSLLDLGIYNTLFLEEVTQDIGMDLFDYEIQDLIARKNKNGVETDFWAKLKYKTSKGSEFLVDYEARVNPGSAIQEDIEICFSDQRRITQNRYVHPYESLGIFEQCGSNYSLLPGSFDPKNSFIYQFDYLLSILSSDFDFSKVSYNPSLFMPCSVRALRMLDQLKSHC